MNLTHTEAVLMRGFLLSKITVNTVTPVTPAIPVKAVVPAKAVIPAKAAIAVRLAKQSICNQRIRL